MNLPNGEVARPALECEGLTRRFGGLKAVQGVNLRVDAGERRAIIGPNSAGKTTLFSLISGLYPVTSGSIRIFGRDITQGLAIPWVEQNLRFTLKHADYINILSRGKIVYSSSPAELDKNQEIRLKYLGV